ncbi:MAG: hypothetical protein DMG32_12840 [Acidobacteria bacterium]|nr:MAG: hypothetical protein DMG32_12840 [Acidobacteriota bacterium]
MKRAGFCALSSIALLFFSCAPTLACSCGISGKCDIPGADVVFLGRVASKQVANRCTPEGICSSVVSASVRFEALENYRSANVPQLQVDTTEGCCACGITFIVGETYLVFANRYEEKLETSTCTATQPAATATALIRQLRTTAKGGPTATLFGLVVLDTQPHYSWEPAPIQPIRGVEVKAVGTQKEFTAMTDGDGAYEFPSLPPDEYSIRAALVPPLSSVELVQKNLKKISVEPGSSCAYNIRAQWDGRIAGRVVDAYGNPVPGFVSLDYKQPKTMGGDAKQTGVGGYTTGPDGRFEFTLVGPDEYRLRFVRGQGEKIDFTTQFTYPRMISLDRGQQITDLVIQVPWPSSEPER